MSLFILDTDVLSLYRTGHEMTAARMLQAAPLELATTVISVQEVFSGWFSLIKRSSSDSEAAEVWDAITTSMRIFRQLEVLTYSETAMRRFRELKSLKLNVGPNDLRIGAIALEHDATVVTRNARDFSRIPGLKHEDWSR